MKKKKSFSYGSCYVVVSLFWKKKIDKEVYALLSERKRIIIGYNHSGDDGKEDPPVPIPNTEVKLFYAESTCRELPGG